MTFYFDPHSLAMSSSGKVTGVISAYIDEKYFPEKQWNDFVVVTLNWWTDELEPFILGKTTEAKLTFMDGPFAVSLISEGDFSRIVLSRNHKVERLVEANSQILKAEVLKSILKTTDQCLNTCKDKKWSNQEIQNLAKSYTRLLGHRQE